MMIEQKEGRVDPHIKLVCTNDHEFEVNMNNIEWITVGETPGEGSSDSPMRSDFYCPECDTTEIKRMLV